MVRAGIHHDGRTAVVRVNEALNAQIYRDEILQHHVVPLIDVTSGSFQHSGHAMQNNVHVLPWPAKSADLSSVEHQRYNIKYEA